MVSVWCSVAVGVIGAGVLWLIRRASLIVMMLVLTVVTVFELAASITGLVAVGAIAPENLSTLLLACIPCGLVSLVVCLLLGRHVLGGSRRLALAARSMGREGRFSAPRRSSAAELEVLSQELAATSAALAESRAQERRLEASRRQLITWVSHDLRTPLAGLRAMAESLQDGVARDRDRYHRQILAETQRLDHMVNELFDLSRIQSNSWSPALAKVSLYDVISDVFAGVEPVARSHGVRIEQSGIDQLHVQVDAQQISRVVTNLLMNGIRHTRPHSAVTISAREEGASALIRVSDECGGVAEADLESVFEAGWRGTRSRTAGKEVGAGLGLAIVRGIVDAHGGEVSARNIPNGCQFTVALPIK